MAKRIFLDIDGVMGDWDNAVLDCMGIKYKAKIESAIENGIQLTEMFPDIRKTLDKYTHSFWKSIKPLPWAHELYKRAFQLGDVAFLTSSGNFKKRPGYVSDGAKGKVLWVAEHFPDSRLLITRDKYMCASPQSILIDDTTEKLEKFEDYGGHTFLWPNQYKIMNNRPGFETVMRELERKIVGMGN